MGNWNVWGYEEMTRDSPGVHSIEVRLLKNGGEFQISRNKDPMQVFHPQTMQDNNGETGIATGPDDADQTYCWFLNGQAGDVFRIEFNRDVADWVDSKRISWRKLRNDPLSKEEQQSVLLPRYFIVGTWDGWRKQHEMIRDGLVYEYTVPVGEEGTESFQIVKEGNWNKRVFPSLFDANPYEKHGIYSGENGHGRNWTIGKHELEEGSAGMNYKVMLSVYGRGVPKKMTWEKSESSQKSLLQPPPVLTEIVPEVAE